MAASSFASVVLGRRGSEPPAQSQAQPAESKSQINGFCENFARYSAAIAARLASFGRPPRHWRSNCRGARFLPPGGANSPLPVRHQELYTTTAATSLRFG